MIVQNLKEGRDREEDEFLNNVEVLVGDMIVIEVHPLPSYTKRRWLMIRI
jgi:hypothetical protein